MRIDTRPKTVSPKSDYQPSVMVALTGHVSTSWAAGFALLGNKMKEELLETLHEIVPEEQRTIALDLLDVALQILAETTPNSADDWKIPDRN